MNAHPLGSLHQPMNDQEEEQSRAKHRERETSAAGTNSSRCLFRDLFCCERSVCICLLYSTEGKKEVLRHQHLCVA